MMPDASSIPLFGGLSIGGRPQLALQFGTAQTPPPDEVCGAASGGLLAVNNPPLSEAKFTEGGLRMPGLVRVVVAAMGGGTDGDEDEDDCELGGGGVLKVAMAPAAFLLSVVELGVGT
jgi:hypothetical protein